MKRKAEDARGPNKRMRQREMKKVARNIPTQQSSHIEVDRSQSVKLPSQIQVDKYLSSYSYEVEALQNAIKLSSFGSSIRAWQLLPRHKRRRNASHNLLALPKRLREKGRAELRASRTDPTTRSETRRKKGKGERLAIGAYPKRKESTRRRELIQRATKAALSGKAWMETHLWHAKRFRMSGKEGKVIAGEEIPGPHRWGFSLPEENSMKSYRSTWRDEKKGASIMDVSYNAWIRVKGSVVSKEEILLAETDLGNVLSKAGITEGWQEEWRDGKRCCKALLTALPCNQSEHANEGTDEPRVQIRRCCGTVQIVWLQSEPSQDPSSARKYREVLIRTHPAAASSLMRNLHSAVVTLSRGLSSRVEIQRLNSLPHPSVTAGSGATVRRHKQSAGKTRSEVKVMKRYLDSLHKKWMKAEAFNTFELGGPLAVNLLSKVLRPVNAEDGNKMKALLKGSLEDGSIVPFDVHDPRLSFPPRSPTKKIEESPSMYSLPCSAYSVLLSQGCMPPTYRKGEIDQRKSKLTIPGSRLLPTSKDDVVPTVVIAHRRQGKGYNLTLLVPRAWGQAFWLSLVYPGTRVIGQVMSQALNFDRGSPSFPFDWAGTSGFAKQEEIDSLIASDQWLRRPPAKRCNWNKMGVRWPFGGMGLWIDVVQNGQHITEMVGDTQDQQNGTPWMFASTPALSLDTLSESYHTQSLPLPTLSLLRSALVCVEVTACRKGSFVRWDEIHFLDEKQQSRWRSALLQVQQDSHSKIVMQKLESQAAPSSQTHIGSVTTANFALSQGKVSAIASISLLAYLTLSWTSSMIGEEHPSIIKTRNSIPLDNLVLVKSVQGGVHRVASLRIASL